MPAAAAIARGSPGGYVGTMDARLKTRPESQRREAPVGVRPGHGGGQRLCLHRQAFEPQQRLAHVAVGVRAAGNPRALHEAHEHGGRRGRDRDPWRIPLAVVPGPGERRPRLPASQPERRGDQADPGDQQAPRLVHPQSQSTDGPVDPSGGGDRRGKRHGAPARDGEDAPRSAWRTAGRVRHGASRASGKHGQQADVLSGALGRQRPLFAESLLELGPVERRLHAAVDDVPRAARRLRTGRGTRRTSASTPASAAAARHWPPFRSAASMTGATRRSPSDSSAW